MSSSSSLFDFDVLQAEMDCIRQCFDDMQYLYRSKWVSEKGRADLWEEMEKLRSLYSEKKNKFFALKARM
jgi:hypothetical protein